MQCIQLDLISRDHFKFLLQVSESSPGPFARDKELKKRTKKLTSQHANVFEKLIDAYKQIAEELLRIDRLRYSKIGSNRPYPI